MNKTKNLLKVALCCFVLALTVFAVFQIKSIVSYAGTESAPETCETTADEGEVSPRLFTQLTVSLKGGNGKVWVTVKNEFTLFPSTVKVIVELYSSDTYCEDYTQMDLIASNSISDLNINKSIKAEASTGGEQKYWLGRVQYKVDKESWKERITGPNLYSASGEYLG